uniref:Uncharacterized protein n=1 Tax=Arundo donax TaxID=35708 RepID=A0A0A8YY65_ARUDO
MPPPAVGPTPPDMAWQQASVIFSGLVGRWALEVEAVAREALLRERW